MPLKHIEFHTLLLSFSIHQAPGRRRHEETTFSSRFGTTTLSDRTLNLRRTGRSTIMFNPCALNWAWDVNEALGVWRKSSRARRRMRSPCRLARAGVCASNIQFQEDDSPVGSSIKETVEPVWGDTLGPKRLSSGVVEILCGLPKGGLAQLDVRGNCVRTWTGVRR